MADRNYTVTQLVDELKTIDNDKDKLEYIAKTCHPHGIRRNFEMVDGQIKRVILCCNKKYNSAHFTNFYYECNGVVLGENWEIASYPPKRFKRLYPADLTGYTVTEVMDGTIVTIYKNADSWSLSTSHAYDVTTLKWAGNLTYAEIVFNLMVNKYPEFIKQYSVTFANGRIDFGSLPADKSYTIGFRSHQFHPYLNDAENIWLVNITELSTLENISLDFIIKPLRSFNYTSIQDLIKSEHSKYGYILKCNDHRILADSPFLVKIKTLMYAPLPSADCSLYINHTNRHEYHAIAAYLNRMYKQDFIALFPQYTDLYNELDKLTNAVIEKLIKILRMKATGNIKNNDELLAYTVKNIENVKVRKIVEVVESHIRKNAAVNPLHRNGEYILRDLVISPYYSILYTIALYPIICA